MNAMAHFGRRLRDVFGVEPFVDGPPSGASVVGPERASSRDGDVHPAGISRILNDGVQAQPTRARLPAWTCAVAAHPWKFLPLFSAVGGAKQRGVFYSGVNGIRIFQ